MGLSIMPFKHNADRRHHIPKICLTVTNLRQYEAGLRQRASLTRCLKQPKPQPSEDAYVAAELALLSLLEGSLVGLSGKRPFLPTEVAPSMAAARAAALCMGRFAAALLEEDAEWLTWI